MKVIAVDLGGTNMRTAIVKNGRVYNYVKESTPKTKEEILERLCGQIKARMDSDVRGIGIASPGPLENGVLKNPPNLPFRNFDLKGYLRNRFKVKVEVDNDANCVALAEARRGVKKKNFIVLTLGTGIGGGIVIDGNVYTGQGYGGELGYMILDDGKAFEKLAAWKRTKQLTMKSFGRALLFKDMIKMNNSKSNKILDEITKYLGQGIASLVNIFDPEIVVLAGGSRDTGEKFLRRVRKHMKKYVLIPRKTPIVWTKLEHAGILGAGLLIEEN